MAFSFGFSGDDIEQDPNDVQQEEQGALAQGQPQDTTTLAPPIPARMLDVDELVGTDWCDVFAFCSGKSPLCLFLSMI